MKFIVYDVEVFRFDWIVVFYDVSEAKFHVYVNDSEGVKQFMTRPNQIFCGFNNKHYDNFILAAIVRGASHAVIKQLNDFIIEEGRAGWEHYFIKKNRFWFPSFDLMDDTQIGTSLKSIEAHLGWDIVETEVDFHINRPLTQAEIQSTVKYCKYDVTATVKLLQLRKGYLNTKLQLGAMKNIPAHTSLYCTNAKLTAQYLGATMIGRDDGRDYIFPPNLNMACIPPKILAFFDLIHDKTIPDEELFKKKLDIELFGCPCRYAWGGVHGSLTQYYEEATDTRTILNQDVSSLYPSLLLKYRYISRNIASFAAYEETYTTRLHAKHIGDSVTAKALKLPLNTVSGAMENKYNDLYDPLGARSTRITGQLFLTQFLMMLAKECTSTKILNFNTDGLMYSIDTSELNAAMRISKEWESITHLELETDEIAKVWIKDVNNLLFIKTNGSVKTVGGYLNYGISEKGAWAINNNHTIVKEAVKSYFVDKIPVEKTISDCNEIFKFQIIAKAGSSYTQVVQGNTPLQKVNRVYASLDKRQVTLLKRKKDGSVGKIGGLPEHCIVDNDNHLTIDQVDKQWYIDLAQKYIADYTGNSCKEGQQCTFPLFGSE